MAIWVNFSANALLLVAKLMVAILTNSLSVLASLVDGTFSVEAYKWYLDADSGFQVSLTSYLP
jgi:hypothetical protein